MGRYRIKAKKDLTSVTAQDVKTLTEILDEYQRSGQLDSLGSNTDSYDFNSAEEVDFNKPVAQDVDIYDAASGLDDPYINIVPVDPNSVTTNNNPESATESAAD